MGTISEDRGPEEIPVLVELEVQQWVDEALRNTARATKRILDRVASMGVRRPDQDCGEASDFDLADSKAAQVVPSRSRMVTPLAPWSLHDGSRTRRRTSPPAWSEGRRRLWPPKWPPWGGPRLLLQSSARGFFSPAPVSLSAPAACR